MGNGASMEGDGQSVYSGAGPGAPSRTQSARSSFRSHSRRGSQTSLATWHSAFKSQRVPPSGLRKMRAAALGRKSACTVGIDKTGFTLQHIRICEGQSVTWEWEAPEGSQGFNVTQVVHDGEKYRPVMGGFNSGPLSREGFYEQQMNLAGEYKFVSAGIKCTPLKVEVYPRKEIEVQLKDDGFSPKVVRVDEGNTIKWTWTDCDIPHSCMEVKFSHRKGCLVMKDNADRPIPTKAGNITKNFQKPGIYYFQTEGISPGVMHTCIVHVRERQREYRVDISDRAFNPAILVIQEGDRVWWHWDKDRCQKNHCVYQIEHPPQSFAGDESYKPYKNGFKWPNPTRCGILSHEFYEAGVFYFSDHNFNEAAEYIGTIIVQPKQVEHFIELTTEGFAQDLIYAETGDRIWWAWKGEDIRMPFLINETEKCVSSLASRPSLEDTDAGDGTYMDEDLEQMKVAAELDTVQLGSIGSYHYKLSDTAHGMSSFSVIVQGGPRNHTVHVTDSGFEPKVVTIHPGDRVWWIWQDTSKQHNIMQVSHQGNNIRGGFASGAATDAPSAFMSRYEIPGVYYYVSSGLNKAFGAVVVASQPKVHEVQITGTSLTPDPVVMAANDVVAWSFKGLRQHDVVRVSTVDQLLDAQFNSPNLTPRRCLSRVLTDQGVHHFTSKSFLKVSKKDQQRQSDETRVSSILVDDVNDSMIVRVSGQGFFPISINIARGRSVLWTWKESGQEAHNIIHVNSPDSDKPLSVIQGGKSFNSGRPVPNNSFLYTFDEPGHYCVASQGAPGFAGTVQVLQDADKVDTPRIISDRIGGTVEKNHTVKLEVLNPEAAIYYTLDGTAPELHKMAPKRKRIDAKPLTRNVKVEQYNLQKGIVLKNSGLCFIRAMGIAQNALNSDIFTSKRFWVLSGGEEPRPASSPEPEPASDLKAQSQMYEWWSCVPTIKGCFTAPGVLEVFWEHPPQAAMHLVHGYQIYLNGVSYCQVFPSNHSSVNIAGIAGGRMYEIELEAFPTDTMYLPHKSNKLTMRGPKTTGTGGPLISLETTVKNDMLSIVWMAISTPESRISGYRVYLNGQMCGNQVVPDANSDRCKVVIEGCALQAPYRVLVAAVPEDGGAQKMSNELEVTLPLDISNIKLPPPDVRLDDEDLYKEYVEVREGSGYVASTAGAKHDTEQFVQTIDLTEGTEAMPPPDGYAAGLLHPPLSDIAEESYGDAVDQDMYDDPVESLMQPEQPYSTMETDPYVEQRYEESEPRYEDTEVPEQYRSPEEEDGADSEEYEELYNERHPENYVPEYQEGMRREYHGQNKASRYGRRQSDEMSTRQDQRSETPVQQEGRLYEDRQVAPLRPPSLPNPHRQPLALKNPRQSLVSEHSDDGSGVDAGVRRASKPKPLQLAQLHGGMGSAVIGKRVGEGTLQDYAHCQRGSLGSLGGYPAAGAQATAEWKGHQSQNPLAMSQLEGQESLNHLAVRQSLTHLPPSTPQARSNYLLPQMDMLSAQARLDHFLNASNAALQAQSFVNPKGVLPPPTPVKMMGPLSSPAVTQVHTTPQPSALPSNALYSERRGSLPQSHMDAYTLQATGRPPSSSLTQKQYALHRSLPTNATLSSGYAAHTFPSSMNYAQVSTPRSSDTPGGQSIHHASSGYHSAMGNNEYVMSGLIRAPASDTAGPRIQGVPYHGQVLAGYGAPTPEAPPEQFIDATQGPWSNRMKTVADMTSAAKRMNAFGKPPLPPGAIDRYDCDVYSPSPGVEVEMYDDSPETDSSEATLKQQPRSRKSKKKRHKTAVVEVQEEAHLHYGEGSRQIIPVKEEMSGVVSAVPILGAQSGQDQLLPAPIVSIHGSTNDEVWVRWHFERDPGPMYRIIVNVINIMGTRFAKVTNSNISFECLMEEGGEAISGIQHCWNVTEGNEFLVKGLLPGMAYRVFVVANYSLVNSQQPAELQAKSVTLKYTTMGPPPPPTLKATTLDLGQVTLQWDPQEGHKDVPLTGYRVMVDGKPLGNALNPQTIKTTIDNLQPGRTIQVNVVATTNHQLGDSETSNIIKVTCPGKPPAPLLSQQPSYKKGAVIVAWEKPVTGTQLPYGEDIICYKIFIDNIWHGEVKSTAACNRNGYQYFLTDLVPGRAYDVNVKSVTGQGGVEMASETAYVTDSMKFNTPRVTYSGQRRADPSADHVFCLSESDMSNTLPVMAPAPPTSPCLRLEGMHAEGIDITWEMPQQFGDAEISGYQLMKDDKMYGSIMPPDVHTLRIKDINLGDRIQLQILALTDHPVGRDGKPIKDRDETKKDDEQTEAGDSGIADTSPAGYTELYLGDRYSNCKPGPKLVVHYTGLVQPPSKVWCERVSGHSAMIVWSKASKPKAHFVEADSYQVTWWPKNSNEDINSQGTRDDHLLVTGLKPNMIYNVVVEARKTHSYRDIQEGEIQDDGFGNTFILTGKSEHLTMRTAKPPAASTNLGVLATTCHSVMVGWDPPHESGIEIVAIRVDAISMKPNESRKHSAVVVKAESTNAVVENLSEKSEYMITVTAITDEYFEQLPEGHDLRRTRSMPLNKPLPEDPWLPSSSMIAMTSGTDPPTDVRIISTTINSVTIMWSPPVVYGSNRLSGTVVRWAEGKFSRPNVSNDNLAHHKSITADCNEALIEDLAPGILYKIVVEAVVSVKAAIDIDRKDPDIEKQNRRTTHVLSKPIFVRTRAPCEPPRPIVTSYTGTTIQLYWEKPLLYSVIGKDANDNPKYLKLALEGYRLEINGKPHMRLVSAAQSCTLVKCRPSKTYKIVLVALTCTDDVRKERRRRTKGLASSSLGGSNMNLSMSSMSSNNKEWEETSEDLENDESYSLPVEVTLPNAYDGMLTELSATYKLPNTAITDDYCGDIAVHWSIHGDDNLIEQYNIRWNCLNDKSVQKKNISASQNHCTIPVPNKRSLYDIRVEPQYKKEMAPQEQQSVMCFTPGSPDPPEIFTKSIGRDDFIIEWGEPRLYGVKIEGYQVYLNGKKVGGVLSSSHRKAVIPCKPKRTYKVNITALTGDVNFPDAPPSNTLLITTGMEDGTRYLDSMASGIVNDVPMPDDGQDQDDSDMRVRITKVTENTIHLDWATFSEPEGMLYYKVTWSSLVQPEEREVKLPAGEKSCVLHKCYPGSVHYMRVWAVGKDDRTLDVSKQLTVQTSAPPDCPRLTQRACNFRYVAIEWDKPKTYGDAEITGYKVYVNGVVEATLGPDQFTYSYTAGKWCREYAFQVQALTAVDRLNSKPSEPLVVTWPGVQAPVLRRAPAVSSNSIKVTWDPPTITDGVSIKCYKVICLDEETEKTVQVISPIHPNTCEAEVHNLKQGSYLIFLEVHLHNSNDVVRSDALRIRPEITPDPPHISVTVIGLEERRSIEKITCDLINKRDRLQNFLHNSDMLSSMRLVDEDQVISKVTEDLTHVEDMLDDCLSSLANYTGHLLVHVSWTCPQSNPDIQVSGFKVLVDGKQYGTTLHSGVKNVRIKLGLNQTNHHLSLVAVSDNPHTTSPQSNVVELLTEPFQPFTFFMFLDNKIQNIGYSYADTLAAERAFTHGLINQGLMRRHVAPPSCSVYEVFEGEYRPLFSPSGPRCHTALLFWARWNVASKRALGWFVRYAKQNHPEFEFMAVSCTRGDMNPAERQETIQAITKNSWRDDRCVRHIGSHTEAPIADPNGIMLDDLSELFGMVGTPMVAIVHPEDYVSWKGRYCAFDYNSFEVFMKFVFAQSMNKAPPVSDPWDNAIDVDALDGVSKRSMNDNALTIHRPHAPSKPSKGGTSTHHVNGRPGSAKKAFFKTNEKNKKDKININSRPYSASSLSDKSPYSQKLGTAQPRRVRSGRKSNSKGY